MHQSLGTVETRGLVGAVQAADAMLKAAKVEVREFSVVGSGLVAVVVRGEVAAVQAAVDAGCAAAKAIGEVVSSHVIPNPNGEVAKLLD